MSTMVQLQLSLRQALFLQMKLLFIKLRCLVASGCGVVKRILCQTVFASAPK